MTGIFINLHAVGIASRFYSCFLLPSLDLFLLAQKYIQIVYKRKNKHLLNDYAFTLCHSYCFHSVAAKITEKGSVKRITKKIRALK